MGTDIHGRVQRRYGVEGRYEDIGEIENGRNYAVFALLAGVRNGTGFAGIRTHDPIQPISEPRGLPADLGFKGRDYSDFDQTPPHPNPQSRTIEYEESEFGDHSYSWVTLKEVIDWPHWDAPLNQCGYLDRSEYEKMIAEGRTPKSWCGDVSGLNVVKTTHAEVQAGQAPENWTDVYYEWSVPFSDSVRTFKLWVDYLESKHRWIMEPDPAAIRFVFGFDS